MPRRTFLQSRRFCRGRGVNRYFLTGSLVLSQFQYYVIKLLHYGSWICRCDSQSHPRSCHWRLCWCYYCCCSCCCYCDVFHMRRLAITLASNTAFNPINSSYRHRFECTRWSALPLNMSSVRLLLSPKKKNYSCGEDLGRCSSQLYIYF